MLLHTCEANFLLFVPKMSLNRTNVKDNSKQNPKGLPGPKRGGQGDNDPGARWLQRTQQRARRNDTEKSVCGRPKNFFFFFEIKSKFGQNCGIFSVCFGVNQTGDA